MKIFIDSADLEEIKEALSWGIVSGITTNPSLIKKAISGKNIAMAGYLKDILNAADGRPVSLEVDGREISGKLEGKITTERMVAEAVNIYHKMGSAKGLNIKIPLNPATNDKDNNQYDGLKAISQLEKQNIPVNATLIMTPEQALLAAAAGASYISPFLGRIDDYTKEGNNNNGIRNGTELIQETMNVLRPYHYKTQVIAASIRNSQQVLESAKAGAHIATIPFSVLRAMASHSKTYEGVERFVKDMVPEYTAFLREK